VRPERVEQLFADSEGRVCAERAEGFARERLRALDRADGIPSVMFLCVHNAGRSQMAAGWLARLGGARVRVFSGGSEPGDAINPAAVVAMDEVGIDIRSQFPKPWSDEVLQAVDVVVTMGCGDECPLYPGTRYVDWQLDDPAGQGVAAVRPIRDEIERRVRGLLAELGVAAV
jgi:protein-tyrosine-phosphatase